MLPKLLFYFLFLVLVWMKNYLLCTLGWLEFAVHCANGLIPTWECKCRCQGRGAINRVMGLVA